jgi:uncharacterized protein (DUF2237 family)
MSEAKNVLGGNLQICSTSPMTGFYRNGCCATGEDDRGVHVVCAEVTAEFLAYTKSQGNDLGTPVPVFGFSGLKAGDRWCLCAARWKEALDNGCAPSIVLSATHIKALEYVSFEELLSRAIDG